LTKFRKTSRYLISQNFVSPPDFRPFLSDNFESHKILTVYITFRSYFSIGILLCKVQEFSFHLILKETLSRDFRPLVFSSNNSIWAPDTRVKAFLHMASYSRRYSTMKSTFLVPSKPPYFLCECCRYSVVQFAYVRFFLKEFPLKTARAR
jgi:hypothetical protein